MLFEYNIKIPLVYNCHEMIIYTKPEFGFDFMLENDIEEEVTVSYVVLDIDEFGSKKENRIEKKVGICLSNSDSKETIQCCVLGIVANSEKSAGKIVDTLLHRICGRLTYILNKRNSNKHIIQPRIEADWNQAEWSEIIYNPHLNNQQISLHTIIKDSVYISLSTVIPSEEISINSWITENDETIQFLLDEYYVAMGTENIKSKFFHLYSIIEFCEKKYEEHNEAVKLLSKKEIMDIKKEINSVPSDKKDKVMDSISNILSKLTNINREDKLLNILYWMNIRDFSHIGNQIEITKELLKQYTELRGKSYHGSTASGKDSEAEYKKAVEQLMIIDEKIIEFVINNRKVNTENDISLRG